MNHSQSIPDDAYHAKLKELLSQTYAEKELFETIVNAPFHDRYATTKLGLGIIVFMLVDESSGTIDRIALSQTEHAAGAIEYSAKPFNDIKIPLDDQKNIIAKAIREQQPQLSADWEYFFTPSLTPEEARINQAGAAIGCSVVYPIQGSKHVGAITYSYYLYPADIADRQQKFMDNYSILVSDMLRTHG